MSIQLRQDIEVIVHDDITEIADRATGLVINLDGRHSPPFDPGNAELWDTLRALAFLEEGLSPSEVRERQRAHREQALALTQQERFRALVGFAVEHVPHYRERAAQYAPGLSEVPEITRLPMLRKSDIRARFPRGLVADGIDIARGLEDKSLALVATSGTTDERLQVVSDTTLDSLPPQYEELWGLALGDETPRTAVFTSPTCVDAECHLGKSSYEERLRGGYTLFLNSSDDLFAIGRDRIQNIAEELHRFKPDFLWINPVYAHWLGRRCRELDIALPKVKLLISTYQYLSVLQRRALAEIFSAPVFSYYAATELAGCRAGIECSRGRLHVRGDQALIETVDAQGRSTDGRLGALAISTLEGRVLPLIRYLVGDLGRWTGETCDCAAADWPCFELHGRAKDLLRLEDRWITTRQVDDAIGDAPGLDFYKCVQTGASELRVEAIPALGAELRMGDIEERLRSRLGFAIVRSKIVKRLDPEPSLKYRLTQSRVHPPVEFV
ncbi:hypothetical protein BE20_23585 [Sorangium cellulosum]|uniref:Coenzyme F390 synthetase n=1 Tax=Sorangium cellulosum TaxID=56 RepID=A0A150RMW2_SORCE|nr:hypothetical protein BE18_18445 [Sorangium cellulosum]KYF88216.1 hypothetical protein BE20_23585 [Sorangium cellulosum]